MSNNISDRDVSDKLLSSAWRDFLANTQDFMFVKNTDLAYINANSAISRSSMRELMLLPYWTSPNGVWKRRTSAAAPRRTGRPSPR